MNRKFIGNHILRFTMTLADQLIYCISTEKFVDFHCDVGNVARPYFIFADDTPQDLCNWLRWKNAYAHKSRTDYDFIFIQIQCIDCRRNYLLNSNYCKCKIQ